MSEEFHLRFRSRHLWVRIVYHSMLKQIEATGNVSYEALKERRVNRMIPVFSQNIYLQ